MTYKESIDLIQASIGDEPLRGKCHAMCRSLMELHPELELVKGHYICLLWGRQDHWWCTDPDGNIVDPTKEQFPTQGGNYEPWGDERGDPTGKCPNCSDYCFNGDFCCTDKCSDEYAAYVMGAI